MRSYHVGTAAVFLLIAAVAMFDSRRGALIGATRDPGGIGSGFYPFWWAAVMAVAAVLLIYRTVSAPQSAEAEGLFESQHGIVALGQLVVPMILYVISMAWLGFYLATGLYMGFFARFLGRYRWPWVGTIAVAVPVVVYMIFEQGFRMLLPKSVLYGHLLLI